MKKEFDIQVEQIQSIVIEMNDYEANYPGMSSKGPFQNISQTLMSAPFCVSSSLMDGEMTLANLKRFEHETLNQLIGKTTIIPEKKHESSMQQNLCRTQKRPKIGQRNEYYTGLL